ncbi:hypothetical protein [Aquimarina litoralis]|uniref:hypothetical protein n=1 Tax=Aquimarina litoralis TaxID=584605 RepID=UPI001C578037|nr:hypothetical protein [Aquimarina litoralis]MBW1298336.1 hypothetical protein [Aquimarina litoralis]
MKVLQIITVFIVILVANGCKATKIDNLLVAPNTWGEEVLEFPLIFARSLPYKGEEHVRFTEGWGNVSDDEYFSYVFVWVLENDPMLTRSKIESDMNIYFTGLMKTALLTKFRFFKKLPKTETSFVIPKDSNSHFEGTIAVYDAFFKEEKIILYTKVISSYCNFLKKHIVHFRLSPKRFNESIWTDLQAVKIKYNCDQ